MVKYIHRFKTVEDFNNEYYENVQQTTVSGLSWGGDGDLFLNTGFDAETNRYIWSNTNPEYEDEVFETVEEVPDVEHGFVQYIYDDGWEEWDVDGGDYSIVTTTVSKRVNHYLEPWLSSTVGRGVDYNFKYEGVDLGLPSGTIWATTNVGARRPEDYGNYYKWGETEPNPPYIWDNYIFSGYGTDHPGKYNNSDHLEYLEPVDDVAHIVMGGEWEMPRLSDFMELLNNTDSAFTALNGVSGVSFTSRSDATKSIFIPAAGGYLGEYTGSKYVDKFVGETEALFLWTSQQVSYPWMAELVYGGEDGISEGNADINIRSNGFSVRGIMKP